MIKLCNDLIQAYKGHYGYERVVQQDDNSFKKVEDFSKEEWDRWIEWKIIDDSPKARLEIYLEWNGILGFSGRIYEIAMGNICVGNFK